MQTAAAWCPLHLYWYRAATLRLQHYMHCALVGFKTRAWLVITLVNDLHASSVIKRLAKHSGLSLEGGGSLKPSDHLASH